MTEQWSSPRILEQKQKHCKYLTKVFISQPVLILPKRYKEYKLDISVFDKGVSFLELRKQENNTKIPVCFKCRRLTEQNSNLGTTLRECRGVAWPVLLSRPSIEICRQTYKTVYATLRFAFCSSWHNRNTSLSVSDEAKIWCTGSTSTRCKRLNK